MLSWRRRGDQWKSCLANSTNALKFLLALTPWFCLLELRLYQEEHLCGMPWQQIINEVMNQTVALGFTTRATNSKTLHKCNRALALVHRDANTY